MSLGTVVFLLVSAAYCGMAVREYISLKKTVDQIEKKVLEGDTDAKRALILVDQVQGVISPQGFHVALMVFAFFWPALWIQAWRRKRATLLSRKTP